MTMNLLPSHSSSSSLVSKLSHPEGNSLKNEAGARIKDKRGSLSEIEEYDHSEVESCSVITTGTIKEKQFDETCGLSNEEVLRLFSKVLGDPNRYLQILHNFVSNAIKFTQSGKSVNIILTILDVQPKFDDAPKVLPNNLKEFSVRFELKV